MEPNSQPSKRHAFIHRSRTISVREIGIEEKIVRCNNNLGTDYEDAIMDLLHEELN